VLDRDVRWLSYLDITNSVLIFSTASYAIHNSYPVKQVMMVCQQLNVRDI
jgi:hypothetical protein